MNLLTHKWIPTLNKGSISHITLEDAMNVPLHHIQSGRADFNFAVLLLAIGLKQTKLIPPTFFGNGERFLQSQEALAGNNLSIENLFLDEPGINTVKNNANLFVKGGELNAICRCCAVIALYIRSQFSGPSGAGYYPGHLYHCALYLIEKSTFGESVNSNLVDSEIDPSAYFSVPNFYWLNDPDQEGECKICKNYGPLITKFWLKGKKSPTEPPLNPHCATTKDDKRFCISGQNPALRIIEGCAPHSAYSNAPLAIHWNASIGDYIFAFSTHYDKASLRLMFTDRFTLTEGFNFEIINRAVLGVWGFRFQDNVRCNFNSSLAGEIYDYISDLLLIDKIDELNAAIATYDHYCLDAADTNPKKYKRYFEQRHFVETGKKLSIG